MTERNQQTVVNVNLTAPANVGVPAAQPTKSLGVAILLWWFLGLFGAHRFYLEREHAKTMLVIGVGGLVLSVVGVGLVALAAVGIWWMIDVFSLSKWVKGSVPAVSVPAEKPKDLQTCLLEEAEKRQGRLTVTQAVRATGESFADVKACLEEMHSSGYVDIDNQPETGVVVYVFDELT